MVKRVGDVETSFFIFNQTKILRVAAYLHWFGCPLTFPKGEVAAIRGTLFFQKEVDI